MSSPTPYSRDSVLRAPATSRRGVAVLAVGLTRLGGLGLSLFLLAATGCTAIGEGPEPDPVGDMSSRPGDLVTTPLCTPKSCGGCCQGDICQAGITSAACGTSGAACGQCTESQKCSTTTFTCAFDPDATWLVAAVKATVSTTNNSTPPGPWRTDGSKPRPLVQYGPANRTLAADIVVSGTPDLPVWTATWAAGFKYAAKDLLSTGIDLQVFDQVTTAMVQPMSSKHHVTLSQQDFVAKTLTYQNWEGVQTLSFVLQKQ